jgi:transposase
MSLTSVPVALVGFAPQNGPSAQTSDEETGSVEPGQMGGHKPKAISGEHAVWLQHRIRESDFTLRGLVVELAERGLKVDYRSVWEFVHAEKLSFKKKRGGWRTRSS